MISLYLNQVNSTLENLSVKLTVTAVWISLLSDKARFYFFYIFNSKSGTNILENVNSNFTQETIYTTQFIKELN